MLLFKINRFIFSPLSKLGRLFFLSWSKIQIILIYFLHFKIVVNLRALSCQIIVWIIDFLLFFQILICHILVIHISDPMWIRFIRWQLIWCINLILILSLRGYLNKTNFIKLDIFFFFIIWKKVNFILVLLIWPCLLI